MPSPSLALSRSLSVSCSSLYFLLHRFYTLSLQLVLLLLPFLCLRFVLLPLSLFLFLFLVAFIVVVAVVLFIVCCLCWGRRCMAEDGKLYLLHSCVCVSAILAPIRYRYIDYPPITPVLVIPFVGHTVKTHKYRVVFRDNKVIEIRMALDVITWVGEWWKRFSP